MSILLEMNAYDNMTYIFGGLSCSAFITIGKLLKCVYISYIFKAYNACDYTYINVYVAN